jgi:hypothetical protein
MEVKVGVVDKVSDKPLRCQATRAFTEFGVSPRVATPRDTIQVSGRLRWHDFLKFCYWGDSVGDDVVLKVDNRTVASGKTGGEGRFQFIIRAGDLGLGRHVIYAEAPEHPRGCYAKSPEVMVEVITEEEKKNRELQSMLIWVGIGVATVVATVGVGIALYQRERQKELLTILAMRK